MLEHSVSSSFDVETGKSPSQYSQTVHEDSTKSSKPKVGCCARMLILGLYLCALFVIVLGCHQSYTGTGNSPVNNALALVGVICLFAAIQISSMGSLDYEVERLGKQNAKYQVQNARLTMSVSDLKQCSDDLTNQLEGFEKLRASLAQYGGEQNECIRESMDHLVEIHDNIKNLTVENERVLLERIVQDVEFLNGEEGLTKGEYERFLDHIPANIQGQAPAFTELKLEMSGRGDMVVGIKEMRRVIDDLMSSQSRLC